MGARLRPYYCYERGLTGRLLDYLDTFAGSWFTIADLIDYTLTRRRVAPAAVNRTVWRLIAQGRVEHRRLDAWYSPNPVVQVCRPVGRLQAEEEALAYRQVS